MIQVPERLKNMLAMAIGDKREAKPHEPQDIVRACIEDLLRLSQQIDAHSKKAPYPHIARRLQQIAEQKRQTAKLLGQAIAPPGCQFEEAPLEIKSGKNHWERINQDIEDQRSLESKFSESARLLEEAAPELSDVLKRALRTETSHKEILLDLLVRADPQAHLT